MVRVTARWGGNDFPVRRDMQDNPVRDYFHNIWQTVYTILVGMRISLKYCFAKTVTLQYPDVAPALQPRYRGFHFFEVECKAVCLIDFF